MSESPEANHAAPPKSGRTGWDLLAELLGRGRVLFVITLAALALTAVSVMLIVQAAEPGSEFVIGPLRLTLRKAPAQMQPAVAAPAKAPEASGMPPPHTMPAPPVAALPPRQIGAASAVDEALCRVALAVDQPHPPLPSRGAQDMGIATGPITGTYHQFGLDLLKLPDSDKPTLVPVPTQGTAQSLAFIRSPNINAGIGLIQADYFEHESSVAHRIGSVRKILSLFREEVHLLARDGINSLPDLNGKRVNLGPLESGTRYTGQVILKANGIKPLLMAAEPIDSAICGLIAGRLDAVFAVTGKPSPLFAALGPLLKARSDSAPRLHFVPLQRSAHNLGEYEDAEISSADYPWMNQPTQTIATRALLVAYAFSKGNRYEQARCKQILRLSQALIRQRTQLLQSGVYHVKWKEVNFDSIRQPHLTNGVCSL